MEIRTDELFDKIKDQITLEKNSQNSTEKMDYCCNEKGKSDICTCDECSSNILTDEELDSIIDYEMSEFEYQIKSRGKDYYNNNRIVSIVRDGNEFIAKVDGSKRYEVKVNYDEDDEFLYYDCTCPCEYPCKHEYAVLLAIKNKEYSNIKLKANIRKKELTVQQLIELIPAEDLKEYILSVVGRDYVCFELEHLEEHFRKYIPRQTYEYYYNNLYNSLVLDGYSEIKYTSIARDLINFGEYQEAFYAVKAIIEAAKDVNVLTKWDDLLNQFPTIGILLRIIYRKGDNNVKSNINEWMQILEENNYYDSLYLEDVILSIK